MKKITLALSLSVAICFNTIAQQKESEIALREYFIDAEFFLAQEFYLDALNDYLQVYQRGYQDNPNINYRIGICYLNISGQKEKSIAYFEKAKQSISTKYKENTLKEKNAPIDVYLYLGNAYRVNNRLSEAIDSYNKYKELLPENETNLHRYVDQQIEACNIANDFMNNPVELEYVNMGQDINSNNDDFKAVISGDGNTLLYMHRLPFYDAVYFSVKTDGKWTKPENITPQIMSDGDQYVCGISYDGKTMLLTREDEFNSDICISRFIDNRWSVSEALGPMINTKYWESHASLSRDGKSLYFASNRNGGVGEMDLYVSELTSEGNYGPAKNLTQLNTELNEDTPFPTEDNQKLYFSSQGFINMGGYDVFVSELGSDNKWSTPENVGYPVSTTDDDLFFYPVKDEQIALFSRIDKEGFGGMDIYEVHFKRVTEETFAEAQEKKTDRMEEITEGEVADEEGDKVQVATLRAHIDSSKGEVVRTEARPAVTEIPTIKIQPVLFGFDKSAITEESSTELDKIIKLLGSYPVIRVELTGYTDPLGPESYNLLLSNKRARAVLNYLASKGIETERISTSGKGETDFIAVNTNADGSDSPEGRKYNRRVEFVFLGVENNVLIIKRVNPVPLDLQLK